jgi:integrase
MAIYKRGKVWWTCFYHRGVKYQASLETTRRSEALDEERKLWMKAESGQLSAKTTDFAKLSFAEAVEIYLDDRKTAISPKTGKPLTVNTRKTESERAVILNARLGTFPVKKITAELLNAYIDERLKTVKAATVNRELDIVRGILKHAKMWAPMADRVKRLRPGESPGRAFTEEEKIRIEKTAPTRPQWRTARIAYILAINTSMRPCEMKGLRWSDFDQKQRFIAIRQSKTDAGLRTIPLNDHAFAAMRELQAGARLEYGDILRADWFCFAGKTPTTPITTWRRAWRSMLKAAHVGYSRFYDTRHTAVTDLLQNPAASEQTVKAIVGHVSVKMLERYSHTRMEEKRRLLENLPQRSLPTVSLHSPSASLAEQV